GWAQRERCAREPRASLGAFCGRLPLLSRLLLGRFARRHPHQCARQEPGGIPDVRRADRAAADWTGAAARGAARDGGDGAERGRRQPAREVLSIWVALSGGTRAIAGGEEAGRALLRAAALLAGAHRAWWLAGLADGGSGGAAHQLPVAGLVDRRR